MSKCMQMTLFFMYMQNTEQAATKLTAALVHVCHWLKKYLHLNINKTVCMFLSQKSSNTEHPDVFIEGQKLMAVSDFK